MKVLFLDTNFFIQCKEPGQIPWNEVFPGDDSILLIVPTAVASEIDRQKQDGNNRRSRQARKANAFFREIVLAETGKISLRDEKPAVEISFAPIDLPNCTLPGILDTTRADDHIIAEMLKYKAAFAKQDPILLTHDTNPLRIAKVCGLSFFVIPDEWLLPPEPDTKDKRIQDLEKQVKEIQGQRPRFEISAFDNNKTPVTEITIETIHYSPLAKEELATICDEIRNRFPMETRFQTEEPKQEESDLFARAAFTGFGFRNTFVPPSESDISKYQKEKYPAWLKAVEGYLQGLQELLAYQRNSHYIAFLVDNSGNTAAESTLIEFEALGDILLLREPDDEEKEEMVENAKFPFPPKAPKGYWRQEPIDVVGDFLRRGHGLTIPTLTEYPNVMPVIEKRDKNGIYWKPRRPDGPCRKWCFECDEFRHQLGKELFRIRIGISDCEKRSCDGAIRCVVSAKNLSKPVEHIVNIKTKIVVADAKESIMEKYREETRVKIFQK